MKNKKTKNITLLALKRGSKTVYENIYTTHYEELCRYLLSYCDDRKRVEDVVQDVFLKLWVNRKKLTIKSSIRSYLYKACYNQLMEKYRGQKRKDEMLASYYYTAVIRATQIDSSYKNKLLMKLDECIDLLPTRCREVFTERKLLGLNYAQISKNLNITAKTIEGHINRAHSLLKNCMNELKPS